jgi:excisionase family DNA binding protein
MNHNKLMAAEQVADLLGVGVHRVYELSRLNILPHIRLGRQLRYSPKQIQNFIENGGQALPGGWRREA